MNKIIVISILLSIITIGLGIDAYAQSDNSQLEKWKNFIKKYKIWANNRIHDYKDQIQELEKTIIGLKEQNKNLEAIIKNMNQSNNKIKNEQNIRFDDYKIVLIDSILPTGPEYVIIENPKENYAINDILTFSVNDISDGIPASLSGFSYNGDNKYGREYLIFPVQFSSHENLNLDSEFYDRYYKEQYQTYHSLKVTDPELNDISFNDWFSVSNEEYSFVVDIQYGADFYNFYFRFIE